MIMPSIIDISSPANREDILTLLRTIFRVLTEAMQDEPANKNFFMDEVNERLLKSRFNLQYCIDPFSDDSIHRRALKSEFWF